MRRTPFKPRTRSLARHKGLVATVPLRARKPLERAHKPAPKRKDTIPPKVRKAVQRRDGGLCVACAAPATHQHHRRLKGSGGDTRAHTDCCCNLVTVCVRCHYWMHVVDRRGAEAEGLIVTSHATEPGLHPVLVHGTDGGVMAWPTCDGRWITEHPAPPREQVAA